MAKKEKKTVTVAYHRKKLREEFERGVALGKKHGYKECQEDIRSVLNFDDEVEQIAEKAVQDHEEIYRHKSGDYD